MTTARARAITAKAKKQGLKIKRFSQALAKSQETMDQLAESPSGKRDGCLRNKQVHE